MMRKPPGVRLAMTVPTNQSGYEWEIVPTPCPIESVDTEPARDWAEDLAEQEIWRVLPSRHAAGGTLEPLTVEWFKHLEVKRYRRHGAWVPHLLELHRHHKESVLAIGDGIGTDWVQLAQPETHVSVVEPNSDRLKLFRKHFSVRNANINLLHGPWEHLPLADARTDVAILFFHELPNTDLQALIREVFRVLRPGGKVITVLPGKFNATRWQDLAFPWRWWRRDTEEQQRFTGASLKDLFRDYENLKVQKRHLRRSELPYLWRWLPLPMLERLMGRFLILKAFKPLQATPAIRLAA